MAISLTLAGLMTFGFEGFVKVSTLVRSGFDILPDSPGVYALICELDGAPAFLEVSSGGHFKGKDPTVSRTVLAEHWVRQAQVLYIGKASKSLRTRVGA